MLMIRAVGPGQTSSSGGGLTVKLPSRLLSLSMVGTLGAQGFSFTSRGKTMTLATP